MRVLGFATPNLVGFHLGPGWPSPNMTPHGILDHSPQPPMWDPQGFWRIFFCSSLSSGRVERYGGNNYTSELYFLWFGSFLVVVAKQ